MDDNKAKAIDYTKHWNTKYKNSEEKNLGWFETDLSPMLSLINTSNIRKEQRVLLAGAGNTRLVDELLAQNFSSIIATDLSEAALVDLRARVSNESHVDFIVDDLTDPIKLNKIDKVDLWIDRAVLHFFHEESETASYFELLTSKVNVGGYVILAEFSIDGSIICSGLPVKRYSLEMLKESLGPNFELVDHFSYTYINPGGAERPYIYTLFKRLS